MYAKQRRISLFAIAFLTFLLITSPLFGLITVDTTNVIFQTANAQYSLASSLNFHRSVINGSHLRLDQSYTNKYSTRFFIEVTSPSNVNLTINSWFPTANSSATLEISVPTSTNISLSFHSPELISASVANAVESTWTVGNLTLTFIVNSDTSVSFTISATYTESSDGSLAPENVNVYRSNSGTTYHFKATYWDGNGYADLTTMRIAIDNGRGGWVNITYTRATNNFTLTVGDDLVALGEGTTEIVDVNSYAVTYVLEPIALFLNVSSVTAYLWCSDVDNQNSGWTSFTVNLHYAPTNEAFSITDLDAVNWVYSNFEYYSFQAVYSDENGYADLAMCYIGFTDGLSWINATYNVVTDEFNLTSGSLVYGLGSTFQGAAKGSAVRLSAGPTTGNQNNLTVIFLFYFEDEILDAYNVDVWLRCEDIFSWDSGWEIIREDYFNIYNLGGRSTLKSSGDAGKLSGGDIFDLYAYNGSWVESTIVFNNLQHVKLLPMIEWNNTGGVDDGNIALNYTVSYFADGEWIQGWSLILHEPNGYTLKGANPVREVSCNVFAYQNGVYQRSYGLRSFFETTETSDCNYMMQLWVDLWFNKMNASSTGGGRVNAYYFPMQDNSHSLFRWLTGSNWGIGENMTKEFMYFDNLLDSEGNILYAQEIDLIQLSCRLSVTGGLPNYVQLTNHQVFDLTLGPTNPFRGVQTPVFDETRVPNMPQGGFLGAVWSALTGAWDWFSNAAGTAILEFFHVFVQFLDSIAAYFGYPGLFSTILGLFSNFWGWFTDSVTWVVGLITTGMTVATLTMAKFGNAVATIVGQWVAMIQSFFNFLGGSYSAGINVWSDLGLATWLLLGAILYPLYLMEVAATKGIDAAINQVGFLINIGAFIVSGLLTIIKVAINLIMRIIESIPVVE